MTNGIYFTDQINYPVQKTYQELPLFLTAEQFIRDCHLLLNRGVSPHQTLNGDTSLMEAIFPYLSAGRFDDHLQLLLPLIQALADRGADFSEMVVVGTETGNIVDEWDLACHNAVFLHFRDLAKKQHPDIRVACQIFEIVERDMDLDDCLYIGHLGGVTSLLRHTQLDPHEPLSILFGKCVMEEVFEKLASNYYEDTLYAFPDLVLALLERHGDPNFPFELIDIVGKGKYQNPTCLHVAYLYWQSLKAAGKVVQAKYVGKAFLQLLRDPRIDVRAKFTEMELAKGGGHFSYTNHMFEGAYIEEGNLAHFALIESDVKTCRMVLSLAHDLIGSTCFTTSGKWVRSVELASRYDPRLSFSSFFWGSPSAIWWDKDLRIRHENISLCHIAARQLDLVACTFITALGGNTGISHQSHQGMIEYAQLYQLGYTQDPLRIRRNAKTFNAVRRALKEAQPLPATLPQAFYILPQEGYDVMYHPGTKCPIVREVLHRGALARNVDNKKHQGYRQNPLIPKLNRATHEDFKAPGVICGHAKPRADALVSDQALYDVGYLTNIMAQDPTFNNGLWKKLEGEVRKLAQHHLCLHVYTGGVFTAAHDVKGPKTVTYRVIGTNEVHMPTHLFKVIYAFDYGAGWRSLAYLIPNTPLPYRTDLEQYYTLVPRIQELTGIDFLGKYK